MSRHQEFDTEDVLLSAMRVFWRKGFEATSIADLLTATGLSKSSLYATFGSKREMFLAAFDAYRNARRAEATAILAQTPARKGIEQLYSVIIEGAKADELSNGCMSINQAVELAPHDEEVRTRVNQDFQDMEDILTKAIERGLADGSVTGLRSARDMARFLVVAFPGLQVMVRARTAPENLNSALQLVLSILDG